MTKNNNEFQPLHNLYRKNRCHKEKYLKSKVPGEKMKEQSKQVPIQKLEVYVESVAMEN